MFKYANSNKSFDRYPYLTKPDIPQKKLTFDEWYNKFPKLDIKELEKVRYIKYKSIWETAQQNV